MADTVTVEAALDAVREQLPVALCAFDTRSLGCGAESHVSLDRRDRPRSPRTYVRFRLREGAGLYRLTAL